MKLQAPSQLNHTAEDILDILGTTQKTSGTYKGYIKRLARLGEGKGEELSFLDHGRYTRWLDRCEASIIIVPRHCQKQGKTGQLFIHADQPSLALEKICAYIEKSQNRPQEALIDQTALIAENVKLGKQVAVGPYCVIESGTCIGEQTRLQAHVHVGRNVQIGTHCLFRSHAVIHHRSQIGHRVILEPHCVIGADGFGYHAEKGQHKKLTQCGNVILEDDVQIGASTSVARARFGSTRVGAGTKCDALCLIAHNVTLGPHCVLCGMSGIAGSTQLENHVTLAGSAKCDGHLHLASGTTIMASSTLTNNTREGTSYLGFPAKEVPLGREILVAQSRVPELIKKVRALEKHECD